MRSFQRLHLQRSQQVLLAATWQMWVRSRRSQDGRLRSAAQPLSHLARMQDITPPWQPQPHSAALAPPAACTCSGAPGRLCPACATRLSTRLLGVSVKAHAHGAQAVRQLRSFQDRDAAAVAAVVGAVSMPGVVLSAGQLATQMYVSVEAKVQAADWLQLCQVADADLKQRDVFQGL